MSMPDTSALPPELVARIVQRVKEELARTESGAQQAAVPPLADGAGVTTGGGSFGRVRIGLSFVATPSR